MIEKIILYIISSGCFAIVFSEMNPFWNRLKKVLMDRRIWYKKPPTINNMDSTFLTVPRKTELVFPRRLKPFDCYQCMSLWTCLFASHYIGGFALLQSSAMASICVVFSTFVMKYLNSK